MIKEDMFPERAIVEIKNFHNKITGKLPMFLKFN